MDSREIALGTLNQLKRASCHALISAMNQYWTVAMMKHGPLDGAAIILLSQQVKANARSMVQICQGQDGYVAWKKIKKRHYVPGGPTEIKRKRSAAPQPCLYGDRDRV